MSPEQAALMSVAAQLTAAAVPAGPVHVHMAGSPHVSELPETEREGMVLATFNRMLTKLATAQLDVEKAERNASSGSGQDRPRDQNR